jgi:hypothetical protein
VVLVVNTSETKLCLVTATYLETCVSVECRYKNISAASIIFCGQVAVKILASLVMYVASLLSVPQNIGPPVVT